MLLYIYQTIHALSDVFSLVTPGEWKSGDQNNCTLPYQPYSSLEKNQAKDQ